jgi:hypothetical protein
MGHLCVKYPLNVGKVRVIRVDHFMDWCYEDSIRAKQMDEKMKKEELHKVLFYLHI